jgi:hypothetical protein
MERDMGTTNQGTSMDDDRDRDRDLDRVAGELASRLRARGVDIRDDDSDDSVTAIEEAVELFEEGVRAQGGDLMVDEPPRGHSGKPDDPRFRLPLRHADESAGHYVVRLAQATDGLRPHRRDR